MLKNNSGGNAVANIFDERHNGNSNVPYLQCSSTKKIKTAIFKWNEKK